MSYFAVGQGWKKLFTAVVLFAVCALAVFLCLFLYLFDNKYTTTGPQGEGGVLILDEGILREYPLVFLRDGWEYYGGELLTPEDFVSSNEDFGAPEYIFIGQYGGFEAGDVTASPHGSASYRLRIIVPDEPEHYLLELPEIFSAYRAYVNGRLMQTMGDPDPLTYRPQVGNRTISIEAGGRIELLIAVSDFSHFYSGITYPPAFGKQEAVSRLLSARLIFRSLLATAALVIGALAFYIGLASKRNRLAALYGLLCLFFIGYTCYPLIRTLTSGYTFFYTIEKFSFCAVLIMIMLLQKHIFRLNRKLDRVFIGYGIFMCFAALILPFTLSGGRLGVMLLYSFLVMCYGWIAALYLTVTTAQALWRGSAHSKALLGGVLIFDTALVMDQLLPMHEPIVSGWFPELACFALVLCIGFIVARDAAQKYRENAVMEERMNSLERLSEMQQASYEMLAERIEEARTLRHDLRHHFTVIGAYLQNGEFEHLAAYVREFQASVEQTALPLQYAKNPVVNALIWHYAFQAEKQGVELRLQLDVDREINISAADLCAILSNLLENALEACRRRSEGDNKRYIALSIGQKPSMLAIRMENSTDGNVAVSGGSSVAGGSSSVVSGGSSAVSGNYSTTGGGAVFLSSKAIGRKGYGLDSIRAVVARYNGEAEFSFDNGNKTFSSIVLLWLT